MLAVARERTSTTTTRQKVATTSAFKSIRSARPFGNPIGSITNPTTVAAIASSAAAAAAATANYSRAAAATTSSASSGTGGTASKNVGSSIIIVYTASLSTPANTTIMSPCTPLDAPQIGHTSAVHLHHLRNLIRRI
ncbi:BQ5605_C023g09688 [Microbotryum silenes-dioicae]|uniref:BQ5605_C023g09688 protein n=1 Tax=Microbotryum silenes-dioicae TaxID=796604 RepID=A0A2X0PLP6_9BASI|nr:BQ5605_C023g09688 [Microbotryum silenes-dioicae]